MPKWNYTPMTTADYEAAVRAAQREIGDNIRRQAARQEEAWDDDGERVTYDSYNGWKGADN